MGDYLIGDKKMDAIVTASGIQLLLYSILMSVILLTPVVIIIPSENRKTLTILCLFLYSWSVVTTTTALVLINMRG